MNIWVVVAVKDNLIEQSEAFFKHEDAVAYAWKLIKEDLFFDEIDADDEPYIPTSNPFDKDVHAENDEGSAAIDILSFTL